MYICTSALECTDSEIQIIILSLINTLYVRALIYMSTYRYIYIHKPTYIHMNIRTHVNMSPAKTIKIVPQKQQSSQAK